MIITFPNHDYMIIYLCYNSNHLSLFILILNSLKALFWYLQLDIICIYLMNKNKNYPTGSISFEQCWSSHSSERSLLSIVQLSVLICIHMVALRSGPKLFSFVICPTKSSDSSSHSFRKSFLRASESPCTWPDVVPSITSVIP